jgi:hypothetical protein
MAFPSSLQCLAQHGFPSTSRLRPYTPAAGPIGQVLALASVVTVALTTWGHAGEAALGAVDQTVAPVAIASEVSLQRANVHCQVEHRFTRRATK